MPAARRADSIPTAWSETVFDMTNRDSGRDLAAIEGRAARVAARRRGIATARRITIGVAVTAAAAISGITGVLAATETDTATTTTGSQSTSTQQSGNQSSTDDWGS